MESWNAGNFEIRMEGERCDNNGLTLSNFLNKLLRIGIDEEISLHSGLLSEPQTSDDNRRQYNRNSVGVMRSTKVLGKKASLYLLIISGTGAAALTYHHTLNPQSDRHSLVRYITTSFNGVVRSSRSLYTITANVVDYKYSLQGLSKDTDQYTRILSEVHLRSAKRILKLCEMNQGFYIKAGQFVASVRQVPKEYSSTLASLQDQAIPCSFEAIREVLISNLGSDLKENFLSIEEQPIAAASIAQVHRALLKDHEEVVLKVGQIFVVNLTFSILLSSYNYVWALDVCSCSSKKYCPNIRACEDRSFFNLSKLLV
ncbi:hypothetical protein E3N88_43872 [Mikania micrantha]|uniref:ABC1 atypical kinase-like domain-containing protein n=1 Tax=Mikania micrantha TaxID=192012 RepID=A0A5N6LE67_9ASTR|nr:hypothetical protein E3N88_43872 [Mikania micrantha]